MSVHQHMQELHALPVHDFPPPGRDEPLPAAGSVAWRVSYDPYDDNNRTGYRTYDFDTVWQHFTETVDTTAVRALVIGQWAEPYENGSGHVVELLVSARERFPALRALFVGDIVMEEAEISWIVQSDVTPVLEAYPELLEFGVRGGSGLVLRPVRHQNLRTLAFEAGGLPGAVVRAVAESELPALRQLELWLGVKEYGGDTTPEDLAPILAGDRFPALRSLGLKNSELQDEIAAAVATAPVVEQLRSLDLSMGILSDTGAEALLAGRSLTHLEQLDLHHHFLSDAMTARLGKELGGAGVDVDLSEQKSRDEDDYGSWVYVAVSE